MYGGNKISSGKDFLNLHNSMLVGALRERDYFISPLAIGLMVKLLIKMKTKRKRAGL